MKRFSNLLLALAVWVGTMVPTVAWAVDVWDGVTSAKPDYYYEELWGQYKNVILIRYGQELAYVRDHFNEKVDIRDANVDLCYNQMNYLLQSDLDMSAAPWTPIGRNGETVTDFEGTFYGRGYSIRINITGATDDYQGLFASIGDKGVVVSLYLDGKIECEKSRFVGGIAGMNKGVIRNCVVRADVSSGWRNQFAMSGANVGGITGHLAGPGVVRYCCMTGNVTNNDAAVGGIVGYSYDLNWYPLIEHCVFYGIRSSTHEQANVYVGDNFGKMEDVHGDDLLDDAKLDEYLASLDASIQSSNYCYVNAIQNPYTITVDGDGAASLTGVPAASRPTKTITLTPAADSHIAQIMVCDADGNQLHRWICPQEASYTFTMPRRNVIVTVTNIPWQGHGTADDPYLISTADDWDNLHALLMQMGTGAGATEECFKGMHFRQTADLDITQGIGVTGEGHNAAFAGTYDGGGHKLRCNLTKPVETSTHPVAPFYLVKDATLKNLHVTGTISGGIHSAGLVAWTSGTVEINDCRVSADIACTDNGLNLAHGGGIVGHAQTSDLTVRRSMFDGKLRATAGDGEGACLGAIIGWGDAGATTSVFDCFECGTLETAGQTALGWKGGSATIDYPAGNMYASDLTSIVPNSHRLYTVTSGTRGLDLDFSCCTWEDAFVGGDVWRDPELINYLVGDILYAFEGNTVQFKVTYPDSWVDADICLDGVSLGKTDPDAIYSFTQGATNSVITVTFPLLTLADGDDNQSAINEHSGKTVDVRIEGRTLYRDGSWNTLCLPFALGDFTGTPLEGATVKTLTSTALANGVLTLNFSDENLTAIQPGVPYIVKWTSQQTLDDVADLEFAQVTIDHTLRPYDDERVTFQGTFDRYIISVEDRSMLYLGAANTLYYPSPTSADNPVVINPFRAYFRLANDLSVGDATSTTDPEELSITSFKLNFGEGETNGIDLITPGTNPSNRSSATSSWYTLGGRRLTGQPTQQGLYITNGRKVMIK